MAVGDFAQAFRKDSVTLVIERAGTRHKIIMSLEGGG